MRMRKRLSLFAIVVLAFCPACGNSRSNGKEIPSVYADEKGVPLLAGSEVEEVEAVVVDQNGIAAFEAYLVADSCAGPFRIDAVISDEIQGFDMTKSQEEKTLPTGEVCEIPVYIYEIGNEGWVKVTPQYDATTGITTGKAGEIYVYSDLFLTDKGIGAMSSLEEFAAAYPDFRIRHIDAGLYVVETRQLKNVQFVINDEYCHVDETALSSDGSVELQLSDFRKESHFTAIRIIKQVSWNTTC